MSNDKESKRIRLARKQIAPTLPGDTRIARDTTPTHDDGTLLYPDAFTVGSFQHKLEVIILYDRGKKRKANFIFEIIGHPKPGEIQEPTEHRKGFYLSAAEAITLAEAKELGWWICLRAEEYENGPDKSKVEIKTTHERDIWQDGHQKGWNDALTEFARRPLRTALVHRCGSCSGRIRVKPSRPVPRNIHRTETLRTDVDSRNYPFRSSHMDRARDHRREDQARQLALAGVQARGHPVCRPDHLPRLLAPPVNCLGSNAATIREDRTTSVP